MAPTVDQTLPEILSRTTLFSLGADAVLDDRRTPIRAEVDGDDLDDDEDDDDLDDDDLDDDDLDGDLDEDDDDEDDDEDEAD